MIATGLAEPAGASEGRTAAKTISSFKGDRASAPKATLPEETDRRPEIPAVNSGSYVRQPVQVPGATVNRREINVPGFLKR